MIKGQNKNKVSVRNSEGKVIVIDINDPRYISGELVHMNKGAVRLNQRNKFYAKNINGDVFLISKEDDRFKSGELVCVTKQNKVRNINKEIKEIKKRNPVNKNGRLNMSISQKEYQIKKRSLKYTNFKYPILSDNGFYIVKNFCIHGDLKISPNDFNIIYSYYDNNYKLYCEKCKLDYISELNYTENFKNEKRKELENLYKFSSKLKESYIKRYYTDLYLCILNNCNDQNINWNEKLFLFKSSLKKRPKCNCIDCENDTYFSQSNRRYTYFCKKHCNGFSSNGEIELYNFILQYYPNIIKKRIDNIELDIYIPELNLAFEFNGLYWHSEIYKSKKYHYNKWLICKNNNIQLIHIWEDDWNYKRNIIQSIILNRLYKIDKKIYARKCIIKNITSEESSNFLINNHLQGACNSSIRLGLFYNNELVSLMTFGKRNIGKKVQFEMLRYCSLINTNVIGSASKLFNYFLKNYSFNSLISFSDCDIFDGNLYKNLGFEFVKHTELNYWWSDNNKRYHRSNFMKHKLILKGKDLTKTEDEIMHQDGYNKIWGTGNLKYEYIKKLN